MNQLKLHLQKLHLKIFKLAKFMKLQSLLETLQKLPEELEFFNLNHKDLE